MKYLKKTKTKCYKFVREVLNYSDMPKMKECSYECRLYLEWLRFVVSGSEVDSYIIVKITFDSMFKSIRVREHDYYTNKILSDRSYDYDTYEELSDK